MFLRNSLTVQITLCHLKVRLSLSFFLQARFLLLLLYIAHHCGTGRLHSWGWGDDEEEVEDGDEQDDVFNNKMSKTVAVFLGAPLWPPLTLSPGLSIGWLRRKETCSVLVYSHIRVEKSVSQGLDVGALDVWVLLMSIHTPRPYIRRQTCRQKVKVLAYWYCSQTVGDYQFRTWSSIAKTSNTPQGQGFELSESWRSKY